MHQISQVVERFKDLCAEIQYRYFSILIALVSSSSVEWRVRKGKKYGIKEKCEQTNQKSNRRATQEEHNRNNLIESKRGELSSYKKKKTVLQ